MASSFDKLSSNLKINKFVNSKKYYSGNQLNLLFRKGVYPYDYVDSMNKLAETRRNTHSSLRTYKRKKIVIKK